MYLYWFGHKSKKIDLETMKRPAVHLTVEEQRPLLHKSKCNYVGPGAEGWMNFISGPQA